MRSALECGSEAAALKPRGKAVAGATALQGACGVSIFPPINNITCSCLLPGKHKGCPHSAARVDSVSQATEAAKTAVWAACNLRFRMPLTGDLAISVFRSIIARITPGSDWQFWSATLADSATDWESLISPIYDWANQSPSRVPLTDWYWTTDGTEVGFQARSVVGGLFIKMLADSATGNAGRADGMNSEW